MICKQCGHEEFEYLGIEDGGGDYGDSVCDQWGCTHCGYITETSCIGDGVGMEGEELADTQIDDGSDDPDTGIVAYVDSVFAAAEEAEELADVSQE